MAIKYVSKDTTGLFEAETGNARKMDLLWGDRVVVDTAGPVRSKVTARSKPGFVDNTALGDTPLLEVYFIDVGQGDGILIRTPDGRHVMIDGGYKRASQPTGKNAADFVDWKFAKDYGLTRIHLDAMLASHNDADHYGGLWDLLNVDQTAELDAQDVRVDAFYHAGVGWWVNPANGRRWVGPSAADPATPGQKYLTQLMGDRPAVEAALPATAVPRLQGEWREFMSSVVAAKTATETPTAISRLSHLDHHLPGFDGAGGGVAIRVLGPVQKQLNGQPVLRSYSDSTHSLNTNGNSLLLRLDFGRVRILLTGDLNDHSQRALLEDYTGNRIELQCDVAKACHHGSEEVSYEFLSALRPAVTVISSGDNEGHDHPRPTIVAASATTGYLEIKSDRVVSPLVYATELARSVNLGKPTKLTIANPAGDTVVESADFAKVEITAKVTKAGDLNPTTVTKSMAGTYIVAGLIYGLVNVRTDGETILCATMNEKDASWEIKKVKSRF